MNEVEKDLLLETANLHSGPVQVLIPETAVWGPVVMAKLGHFDTILHLGASARLA